MECILGNAVRPNFRSMLLHIIHVKFVNSVHSVIVTVSLTGANGSIMVIINNM